MYQRGVEQAIEDFGWVLGLLSGWEREGEVVGKRRAGRKAREVHGMGRRREGSGYAAGPGARTGRGRTRGGGW